MCIYTYDRDMRYVYIAILHIAYCLFDLQFVYCLLSMTLVITFKLMNGSCPSSSPFMITRTPSDTHRVVHQTLSPGLLKATQPQAFTKQAMYIYIYLYI